MPIYEYKCTYCDKIFEEFQLLGSGNENVVCPNCGTRRPQRLFSAFASSAGAGAVGSTGSSCRSSGPFT